MYERFNTGYSIFHSVDNKYTHWPVVIIGRRKPLESIFGQTMTHYSCGHRYVVSLIPRAYSASYAVVIWLSRTPYGAFIGMVPYVRGTLDYSALAGHRVSSKNFQQS